MVGVPVPTVRTSIVGSLYGSEEFNWSVWSYLTGTGIVTQTALDTFTNGVNAHMAANQLSATAAGTFLKLISTDSSYTDVKTYVYAPSSTTASLQSQSSFTAKIGTGSVTLPNQVSLVCSLKSAVPSRTGRGRVYLPANGYAFLANHQIPSAGLGEFADQMKELLDFMNTLAISGNSVRTCVRSITASVARDITRVVIDSKPDVQRRRAASEAVLFTESRTLA